MRKQWLAAAFSLVLAAIVYVPVAQPPLENEPDLSFRATTHDAFARRMQLGRDIISTYGPWGILQHGYDPRTDGAVHAASALLAAAFGWGVFRLARDAKASALANAAIALTAAALVATAGLDGRFTVLLVLLALSMLEPWSPSRELPLVAVLGLVALIKFTLLLFAPLVVIGVAMARRRVAHVVVFAGALVVSWIAAGQSVAGFPRFVATAAEVARGYGAASSVGSGVPLALYAAAGLVLLCAAIERDVVRVAVIGGTALLLVRIGYVRADLVHTSSANAVLLFLIGAYLLIRNTYRVALAGGVAAALVALLTGAPVLAERARVQWLWLGGRGEHLAALQRDLALLAGPAPAVAGTIDAYPSGSAALIAHGLRYTPRPVFQSAMTWTAKLAAINADFLRGPRAPQWLWADVGAVDGRLPLLDDGASWLEMVRRYDVLVQSGDHLLLQRSESPKPLVLEPAEVGARGLVWCTIDIDVPIGARIRDAVGRARSATLELTTAGGARTTWRAAPDALRGGFLLSPLVANVDDLALLFAGDDRNRVTGVRVTYDGARYVMYLSAVRTPRLASGTAPAPSGRRTSRRR